jgi:hypothetical protein
MPWLPEFNALTRGVVEYRFLPNTWNNRELRHYFLSHTADTLR